MWTLALLVGLFALALTGPVGWTQEPTRLKVIDPLKSLRTVDDIRMAEDLEAIKLVAPRNGYASAQVIVMGGVPCKVAISNLESSGNVISPESVKIRYARKGFAEAQTFLVSVDSDPSIAVPYYDVLDDAAEENSEIVPVWITLKVPPDAKPGQYRGTLAIDRHNVLVSLKICRWKCPDPSRWATHVGILSSPETLALHYGVELWSKEHWALVNKELTFVSGLGNDDLWLSIYSKNYLGQDVPWITFSQKSGSYQPNLEIVRKYLGLYSKETGNPHLLLEIWNSARYARTKKGPRRETEILVDGKWQKVPLPGMPGGDKVWKPLFGALKKEVLAQGWGEDSILIGCADDARPSSQVVSFFNGVAPDSRWAIWTHGRGDSPPWEGRLTLDGMEIGHYEHFYCPRVGKNAKNDIVGGWDLAFQEYTSVRNCLAQYAPLAQYRSLAEGTVVNIGRSPKNMARSASGFTRIPLDFWPVSLDGDQGSKRSLLLAYEQSPWDIFFRNNTRSIIAPGPNGPLGTVRYEMIREGLQECEARIVIEKALKSKKLPSNLEARCRKLLRQRLKARESDGKFKGGHPGNALGSKEYLWGVSSNWQESTAELFELAAEAEQAAK